MHEQSSIPTTKVERAMKFVGTGFKVGGNYVKHYTKKILDPNISKAELHADNAEDIYNVLSNLKGSALKVAQMMSMDQGLLPKEYVDKFSLSQYSAPPLSGPLVMNTFVKTLGRTPSQLFEEFDMKASNAASIGQVHKAKKDGKLLAVKIQYPGIANSVSSDLKLVKPFATRLVGMKSSEVDKYFDEVESKLLEETNYELELARSIELSNQCKHIPNLHFPTYYPELSSSKIITMDWLEGQHLKEFLLTNPSQEIRNKIGQAMWDFYDFQVHQIKKVHADPHPGNFLMRSDGQLSIFDFGCVKEIPQHFYENYFAMLDTDLANNESKRREVYKALEMIHDEDSESEIQFFSAVFQKMIDLLSLPFKTSYFDFGNPAYFQEIYAYGEYLGNLKEIRESNLARGSKHSLYVNRTYFGLYSLLSELKANVKTSYQ